MTTRKIFWAINVQLLRVEMTVGELGVPVKPEKAKRETVLGYYDGSLTEEDARSLYEELARHLPHNRTTLTVVEKTPR